MNLNTLMQRLDFYQTLFNGRPPFIGGSWFSLYEQLKLDLRLCGNYYILKIRNNSKTIVEVQRLDPTVVCHRNGQYHITTCDKRVITVSQDQIVTLDTRTETR